MWRNRNPLATSSQCITLFYKGLREYSEKPAMGLVPFPFTSARETRLPEMWKSAKNDLYDYPTYRESSPFKCNRNRNFSEPTQEAVR